MVRFHWQLQILFMANVSEIKTKGLKAASWNFLNMMVNQLRNFIVSLVLARLLTPSDFGLVSMAMVLNSILDFLVDFGFSSAVVRNKTISIVQTSTIFWLNIILGCVCSVLVFGSAPILARFYEMPALQCIVYVTSWSFLISSFGTLQTSLFQRDLNFRKPFMAKLFSGITSGVIGIILALCDYGVWALVYSNLTGWMLYSVSIWLMSKWRPKFVFDFKSVSDMVSFGWKITLSTLINRIVRQLDTFIIGKLFSPASLGLFNRAQSLNHLVIDYSFSSIRTVMLPSLSKLQDDHEMLRYSVIKLLHVISFLTFLVAGLMYTCANDLILFLYGPQWIGSVEIFKIIGLFSIAVCLPVVFDTVLTVVNQMTLYLWISVLSNLIKLLSIPIGLIYGFLGYIWAVSIAQFINLIPRMIATYKSINLSVHKQILIVFSYITPFVLILWLWSYININLESHIINIILNGSIFLCLYVIANFVLRNDGLKACWLLLKGVIKKKIRT